MTCEDHGHLPLVSGGDDFFIAHGTAGLDGCGGTCFGAGDETIGKREHRIGGDDTSLKTEICLFGLPDRDTARIDAGHLACTDGKRAVMRTEDDGV